MFQKVKKILNYKKIKNLYLKYERVLMPGTLVFGFVVDAVTFRTIDINSSFIIMVMHVVLAGSAIFFINAYDAGKIRGFGWRMKYSRYIRLLAPFVLQLSFGALLSAAFIFYFFASSFAVSWPFLIVLIALAFSNEIFRSYYVRPVVQIGMYYFSLCTVLAVIFPYVFTTIASWPFFLAGICSLILVLGFIRLLSRFSNAFAEQAKFFVVLLLCIFAGLVIFYIKNIIPPIPLSVSYDGVYSNVVRVGGDYVMTNEKQTIFDRLASGQVIHLTTHQPVYVFTAVRAPGGLQERVIHHWQQYDTKTDAWISRDRLSFYITGGRVDGYRGYSYKTSITPGLWRVDVETEKGRIFGRIDFRVEMVNSRESIETETIIK